MIKINLLPLERRRKDRTPLPRFLILVAGVIGVLLLLVWNGYLFTQNKKIQQTIKERQAELQGLQGALIPFAKYQAEQVKLLAWKQAKETVEKARPFKWWENVDILLDIFEQFPKIWISSLSFGENLRGKVVGQTLPVEAKISFNCHYVEKTTDIMTKFRKELKLNPELNKDFDGINPPDRWSLVPVPGAKENWEVQFHIVIYRLKR